MSISKSPFDVFSNHSARSDVTSLYLTLRVRACGGFDGHDGPAGGRPAFCEWQACAAFVAQLRQFYMLLGANQKTLGLTTLSGWFEGMLMDFEPGGMHVLTGMDLQQLSGKVLKAQESGDEGLLQLDRIFKSTPRAEDITTQLDAFFLGRLPLKEDVNYARIRKVVAACDEAKGNISAAEMASVACLGERQFLRVFRSYVGISPKQFIRLRRFHRTLQEMQRIAAEDKPIDLMAVALNHGYYDLSHMALEFQQMGCVTPSQFRMLGIPLTADFSVFFA